MTIYFYVFIIHSWHLSEDMLVMSDKENARAVLANKASETSKAALKPGLAVRAPLAPKAENNQSLGSSARALAKREEDVSTVSPTRAYIANLIDALPGRFNAEHRAYLTRIANYGGDHPLSAWQEYIAWARRTFSEEDEPHELVQVLKPCVHILMNHSRYANDREFLDVCILLADLMEDPESIFQIYAAHGIGSKLADYYHAYALILESRDDFEGADVLFMKGFEAEAEVPRLVKAYSEFKTRRKNSQTENIQTRSIPQAPVPQTAPSKAAQSSTSSSSSQQAVEQGKKTNKQAAAAAAAATTNKLIASSSTTAVSKPSTSTSSSASSRTLTLSLARSTTEASEANIVAYKASMIYVGTGMYRRVNVLC